MGGAARVAAYRVAERGIHPVLRSDARQSDAVPWTDGSLRDAQGMLIERFGLFDNLMIEAGILASGGKLIAEEIAAPDRWTDLSVFEHCVQASVA
jgi:hypothetical protein